MPHLALIACASRKQDRPAPARHLYRSDLFDKSIRYAENLGADRIYILSAKHGLLPLDQVTEPYDVTLNRMKSADRRAWAERVLRQLTEVADLQRDRFTLLAGQRYREHILPHLCRAEVPLHGLPIGKQLSFLKAKLEA